MKHWLKINGDNSFTYLGHTYGVQPTEATDELPAAYVDDVQWLTITGSSPSYVFTVDAAQKAIDQGAEAALNAKEATREKYRGRVSFSNNLKADIMVINDSKGWTNTQVQNYLANPLILNLNILISSGSLSTAKDLLEVSDLSVYYTDEEKQDIIDEIQNYLDSE